MSSSNGVVRAYRAGDAIAKGEVFTTGQVATICHVVPRTVAKWFDSGRLKGWRIPGSQDRRISRDNLLRFLRAEGLDELALALAPASPIVHLVGLPSALAESLAPVAATRRCYTTVYLSLFDLGVRLPENDDGAVVLDAAAGRSEVLAAVRSLRRHRLRLSSLVVLAAEDDTDPAPWVEAGASAVLGQPVDVAALAAILWPERR